MKKLLALALVSLLLLGCLGQGPAPTATGTPTAQATATPTLSAVDTSTSEEDLQASQQELAELSELTGALEAAEFDVSEEEAQALGE